MLLEQNQKEQKQIAGYKKSGFTTLSQKEWKSKKKSDPNGQFVNVGAYYYGYKASTPKQDKKDKEVTTPEATTKPEVSPETKPSVEPVIIQPTKRKIEVDCTDVWSDDKNPFIRNYGDDAGYNALMFLEWIVGRTPSIIQPYLGQCGFDPSDNNLHKNAVLKRLAEQPIHTDLGYLKKVEFWAKYVNIERVKDKMKTSDDLTASNQKVRDEKTDTTNVTTTTKVKDSRLEYFYDSVRTYTNSLGLNTYSDPNKMGMTRGICDSILKEYVDLSRLFSSSFDKTGFERKEFAENQTKAKRFLYFCYSKFTKKYSDDPNFRSAMQLPKDWVVNISDINKNDVNESSLKESVIKKLKNKKEMKNLTESVRNKLITVKTKKRIQEESLKIKLSILSEELKNKNYQMMFEKISSEFNNTGKKVLTEEETMSLENGIKRLFSGKESKLKEKVVSHILSKLKLTEGSEVYNKVKTELESTSDSDILRLITDCNYTAGKIVNSLPDTLMSQMKNGSETESLSGIVRNAMASAIADKSMVDDIKYKVAQLICPSLKDLESNINKESESLISKYLNSKD